MNVAELAPLIDQAGFIFRGRVAARRTNINFTVVNAIDPVPVIVDEILLSTEVMGGFAGREVFMISDSLAALAEGAELVFFTNILVLADHVFVRSRSYRIVGRYSPGGRSAR